MNIGKEVNWYRQQVLREVICIHNWRRQRWNYFQFNSFLKKGCSDSKWYFITIETTLHFYKNQNS